MAPRLSMAGVEELYKQFGILADAKEKAGEVREFSNMASLLHLSRGHQNANFLT